MGNLQLTHAVLDGVHHLHVRRVGSDRTTCGEPATGPAAAVSFAPDADIAILLARDLGDGTVCSSCVSDDRQKAIRAKHNISP